MNDNDTTETTFDSAQGLMALANDPSLHADEKPLLTPGVDEPDELEGFDDVTFVDGYKLVYNSVSGQPLNAVTDDYEIINPPEFVGPLVRQLRDRDHDVHGTLWTREHGAKAYAQVLLDDTHAIHLPGRSSDPVKVGFQLRWSHDGGISVRADGFAQDTACTNSIRKVTSPIHVKHAGDVDGRVDWDEEWEDVLNQLGAFSEALAAIIEDAMDLTLFDLSDPPSVFGRWREVTDPLDTLGGVSPPGPVTPDHRDAMYAYYALLGFPKYLAVSATTRLMTRLSATDDPRHVTAWDVHSAATYALSHDHRGTPGASDDDYHRTASDILLNPEQTIDAATGEAMDRSEPDEAAAVLDDAVADSLEDDVGDALRTHRERLEASFGG